jgi:hypothetical protein
MFREHFMMPGMSSLGFRYFPGGSEPDEPTYHMESRVVGHKYYVGVHMIVTQAPIDAIKEIWVGEDWKVWEGTLGDGSVFIDKENLFGGEKKGGGVKGTVINKLGKGSQGRDSYLQSVLGSDCPAFRWQSSVILKDMYIGTQTYPKPWAVTAQKILTNWQGATIWYSSKAAIGWDMNPAHIIYELLISQTFGKGLPISYIDDASFRAVADTLYTENFGLSYNWSSDQDPEAMIGEVLSTINGSLFQNMSTGKFELALARKDYNLGDLDTYDEDNIIEIKSYTRPTLNEVPNWVVIQYHDRDLNQDRSVTVHDLAMMDKQGGIVSTNISYLGVCDSTLATSLAGRELLQFSSMLATLSIKGNRTMSNLRPNDMIKVSWSNLGIVSLPVRITAIDYGALEKGEVTIHCVEDVFAAGQGIYDDPEDTLWTEPWNDPVATTVHTVMELPYGMIIDWGVYDQNLVDNSAEDAGVIGALVAAPTIDSVDYLLQYRVSPTSNFVNNRNRGFAATAVIANSGGLAQDAATTVLDLDQMISIQKVEDNTLCMIEDEICEMVSIDFINNQITVKRGMWDTVPTFHAQGSRIWFLNDGFASIRRVFYDADTPAIRPVPRTTKGALAEGSAAIITASLESRGVRPYPPINFKINTVSYPDTITGEAALTWSHHNRKTSLGSVITANENPGHSLEVGETYTLKIYKVDSGGSTLLRTETLITDAFYTYDELDERSDGGLDSGDPLHSALRFVLSAHRVDSTGGPTYDSWTEIDFTTNRV